ncbi:BA75_03780T0 [Komagataella pastoris]|uniref:BA75_03780T0 n=1 Tax=Komagataella pastoris TaxID=4922 RepID=A0A1B2JEM2_PICPA|nr:BA75_03780T0 [Komagataella pastoris]
MQNKSDLRYEEFSIAPGQSGTFQGGAFKGRAKKIACVECRQQKCKCDASDKAPKPCTRCTKKQLVCTLQSDFKRTVKRARMAQIEKEFIDLRRSLQEGAVNGVPLRANSFGPSFEPSNQLPSNSTLPPIRNVVLNNSAENSMTPFSNFIGSESPPVQSALKDDGRIPQAASTNIRVNSTSSEPTPAIHRLGNTNHSRNEPIVLSPEVLICSDKTLDDFTIESQHIKQLYQEFVDNYHPILPVVDIYKGPERIYRLCPVLFWTIIFISLRRFKSNELSREASLNLYMKLGPILKSAMAELTIAPITRFEPTEVNEPILNVSSVYSVQSFLLYTFWPPLTSSLSADTSWNTIGIAIFQAIRIGLHSAGQLNSNEKAELVTEQIRTWIACNVVSQTIASAFGFPAFTSFDAGVLSICRAGSNANIPQSLIQMMELEHLEDQAAKTLNSNPADHLGLVDATERIPLLQMLGNQTDELEIKMSFLQPLDDVRRFQLLSTRMRILTYYFLDTTKVATFELQRGLIKVFNAALALIAHTRDSTERSKNFIKYLPGVYILTIWQASVIVNRIMNSPMNSLIDVGAGKQLYQIAIDLTSKASVVKYDMAHRSSGIMRSMWALFHTLNSQNFFKGINVTIRSRLSASVFFDSLLILKEQCGVMKFVPMKLHSTLRDATRDAATAFESDSDNDVEDKDTKLNNVDPNSKEHSKQKVNANSNFSTSESRKKQRSLSSTIHPESSARRIINTIPLDPQPIEAPIVNRKHKSSKHVPYAISNQTAVASDAIHFSQQSFKGGPTSIQSNITDSPSSSNLDASAGLGFDIWDSTQNWDTDLLWKDIDNVMNEFGFHADMV